MIIKTTILLWRVGNIHYNKQENEILNFESINKCDKEHIKKIIEDRVGFKLYDNNDIKQKQYETLDNSFIDKNGIVEIRYFEHVY